MVTHLIDDANVALDFMRDELDNVLQNGDGQRKLSAIRELRQKHAHSLMSEFSIAHIMEERILSKTAVKYGDGQHAQFPADDVPHEHAAQPDAQLDVQRQIGGHQVNFRGYRPALDSTRKNCMFEAVSISVTEFRTDTYATEIRSRLISHLAYHHTTYKLLFGSPKEDDDDDDDNTERNRAFAIFYERLVRAGRQYEPVATRFLQPLGDMLGRHILLLREDRDGRTDGVLLSNAQAFHVRPNGTEIQGRCICLSQRSFEHAGNDRNHVVPMRHTEAAIINHRRIFEFVPAEETVGVHDDDVTKFKSGSAKEDTEGYENCAISFKFKWNAYSRMLSNIVKKLGNNEDVDVNERAFTTVFPDVASAAAVATDCLNLLRKSKHHFDIAILSFFEKLSAMHYAEPSKELKASVYVVVMVHK